MRPDVAVYLDLLHPFTATVTAVSLVLILKRVHVAAMIRLHRARRGHVAERVEAVRRMAVELRLLVHARFSLLLLLLERADGRRCAETVDKQRVVTLQGALDLFA